MVWNTPDYHKIGYGFAMVCLRKGGYERNVFSGKHDQRWDVFFVPYFPDKPTKPHSGGQACLARLLWKPSKLESHYWQGGTRKHMPSNLKWSWLAGRYSEIACSRSKGPTNSRTNDLQPFQTESRFISNNTLLIFNNMSNIFQYSCNQIAQWALFSWGTTSSSKQHTGRRCPNRLVSSSGWSVQIVQFRHVLFCAVPVGLPIAKFEIVGSDHSFLDWISS